MSDKINEQLVLNYSNPSNNYGSDNLRDIILVLHESGKNEEIIYNVLNLIGVPRQRAFEAIEKYLSNKKTKDKVKEMGLQEKIQLSKKVLTDLEKISSEDGSLKNVVKGLSENISMMVDKSNSGKKKQKMKNTASKLNIKSKLTGLKAITEELGKGFTTSSVKSIIEKYEKIYLSQTHTDSFIAIGLVNEMQNYMWIDGVSEIVNKIYSILNENAFSIQVENTYNKLLNSNQNVYFSSALPVLEKLMGMEEKEIIEQASYLLHPHTWIPEIKAIVEGANLQNMNVSDTQDHVVSKKYSPVLEFEGGYVFSTDGNSFIVKNGEINKFDARQLGAAYLTLLAVEENAKFSNNKITFYRGKHVYEVNLNEGDKTFTVDGRELLFKERDQLKNLLVSTCHFDVNENQNIDILVSAYEHANRFVELDFMQSISPRFTKGVKVNVMRVDENIYVNRINKMMKQNDFIKAENATHAVELVKEFINYDISTFVKDALEQDVKMQMAVKEMRQEVLDKIDFLTEKKASLKLHDTNNQFISEAYNILENEIKQLKSELNNIK
jgi:hypothetical protein